MSDNSKDVMAIVDLFEQSDWDEMHIELDGLHLFLSRKADARLTSGPLAAPAPVVPSPSAAPASPPAQPASASAAPPPESAATASAAGDTIPDNWVAVSAPNLGTFYRAPKPGAAPFVEIGQDVSPESEICLLEVMKLFTSVTAGVAGKVVKVCVEDAEMVEHGQPLFYIEQA